MECTRSAEAREALASLLLERQDDIAGAWAEELCRSRPDRPAHYAPKSDHVQWIHILMPAMAEHLRNPSSTESMRIIQRLVAHEFPRDLSPMLVVEGQIALRRIVVPMIVDACGGDVTRQHAMLEALCGEAEFHIIKSAQYCAELTSELSGTIDRIAALHEIGEILAGPLQLDDVLQRTAKAMRALIPFDRISLALLDEDRRAFEVVSLETHAESDLGKGVRVPVGGSRLGYVLRTGRVHIEDDLQKHSTYWEDKKLLAEGIRSCLSVPLRTKEGILGMLNFGSWTPGQYKQSHADAVWGVSRQLATVVENAKLYAELQQSHRELESAHKELQKLSELKSQFLANTSHELRTPLVSLMGYVDMLMAQKMGTLNERQRKGLEICARNVQRLHRLIEDLLDAAHLEKGPIDLQRSELDLVKMARSCIKKHSFLIESKHIHVIAEADPPCIRIWADEDRLEQAVYHVLSNALKFTPEGSDVRVEIRKMEDEGKAVVRIIDRGPGIHEQALPYIFEPFRQVDGSMTRKHGGFGLGLSIARQVVEAHGGDITVETEEGKGTTVVFEIPLGRNGDRATSPSGRTDCKTA